MSQVEASGPDRDDQLDRLITDFTVLRDSGLAPDPSDWIRRHPEFEAELREYFGDEALMGAASSQLVLRPDSRFASFRIIRVISRRDTGDVYEAERDGRRVALKVYSAYILSLVSERARFRREAEALRALEHPNIVELIECGEVGGVPYLAMPLIVGGTLSELFRALLLGDAAGKRCVAVPGRAEAEHFERGDACAHARAVAAVGIQAAMGLEHAHSRGILHRDVKPGNLMLDTSGNVILTDFGLALPDDRTDLTQPGDIVGTHRYLAPERWRGWSDARGDIYALGLTLYELATLHRAFADPDRRITLERMAQAGPPRPRKIALAIPRPLEAIILGAIQPEPSDRYATAGELAADLGRFLDGRPIAKRRPNLLRRLRNLGRRHPFAVLAVLVALAMPVAVAAAWGRRAEAEFERRLSEIRGIRSGAHLAGWSDNAWRLVKESRDFAEDERLRGEAASLLVGLDSAQMSLVPGIGGSSLAFDAKGECVAVGGAKPTDATGGYAAIWDVAGRRISARSRRRGPGPVAFTPDGRALQLLDEGEAGVVLAEIDGGREIGRVRPPVAGPRLLALAPDGARLLVAAPDSMNLYGAGSERLAGIKGKGPGQPTSAAFSLDSSRLAVGDYSGVVRVFACDGFALLAEMKVGPHPVRALTFGPDPIRDGHSPRGELIAAGDDGGIISILDPRRRATRNVLVGNIAAVTTVAFSADGMFLASGSRQYPLIWNPATGQPVLRLPGGRGESGLAFDPSGRMMALAGVSPAGEAYLMTQRIDDDRGVTTLYGTRGALGPTALSNDGHRVAAVAHDWGIGVWDIPGRRLIGVLEGPMGYYFDNCGLGWSPDARKLIASAGTEARMWDVASGRIERTWPGLPPGIIDRLAWAKDGRILLLREERIDGRGTPGDTDYKTSPRRLRVRDLSRPGEAWREPILEFPEYRRVNDAALTPDGARAVVHVIHKGPDDSGQTLRVVDIASKRDAWPPKALRSDERSGYLGLDPSGTMVLYYNKTTVDVADSATGELLWSGREGPLALGRSGLNAVLRAYWGSKPGVAIRPGFDRRVEFMIETPERTFPHSLRFSNDSRRLIWGNSDSEVMVCEIAAILGRIRSIRDPAK